ncbi:MAG: glycine betaine ABC transporter substrate-binding protein, partial [Planctomycetota bacterium]
MKYVPLLLPHCLSLAMLLGVLGLNPDLADADERHIRVGCKAFTESVVLATITEQLIETVETNGKHYTAETIELGGTQVVWKALLANRIDVYPEYTGTLTQEILADEPIANLEEMRKALKRRDITMLGPLGFSNNYAIGMLQTKAAELKITDISDLARHADLNFGFSNEFMDRADGWPGLRRAYSLPQSNVRGLDHDLAYRGLSSGAIDVMELYTTDAEIEYYDMRVLQDNRNYFPTYEAVLLVRDEIAAIPEVREALERLVG